jgi:hypothetical protein
MLERSLRGGQDAVWVSRVPGHPAAEYTSSRRAREGAHNCAPSFAPSTRRPCTEPTRPPSWGRACVRRVMRATCACPRQPLSDPWTPGTEAAPYIRASGGHRSMRRIGHGPRSSHSANPPPCRKRPPHRILSPPAPAFSAPRCPVIRPFRPRSPPFSVSPRHRVTAVFPRPNPPQSANRRCRAASSILRSPVSGQHPALTGRQAAVSRRCDHRHRASREPIAPRRLGKPTSGAGGFRSPS